MGHGGRTAERPVSPRSPPRPAPVPVLVPASTTEVCPRPNCPLLRAESGVRPVLSENVLLNKSSDAINNSLLLFYTLHPRQLWGWEWGCRDGTTGMVAALG